MRNRDSSYRVGSCRIAERTFSSRFHRLGTRIASQRGQVFVLAAISMVGMSAMAGFVIDAASWYKAHRRVVAIADASSLAAAQALPGSTSQATAFANSYAAKNGGSIASIAYSTKYRSNDTVTLTVNDTAPAYFSKVLGFNSVSVSSTAAARVGIPRSAQLVSPFTVGIDNPYVTCIPACYGNVVTMSLPNGSGNGNGANFSLVDLSGGNGTVSAATLASWLQNGYPGSVSLGSLKSAQTSLFNSPEFRAAMNNRIASGNEVTVLVHSNANGNEGPAGGATYQVVGWAAFKIQSYTGNGSSGTLTGYFTQSIVRGDINTDGSAPDWGVKTVALVR